MPWRRSTRPSARCGTRTTHGLPARCDRISEADCATVARCRAAGLVLFGKTHTAPLGLSVETVSRRFGATRNPWDASRSAGGSSGGAAAAVAAGLAPVAQASDGAGSLRLPAACCGVLGLMPTAARAPLGQGRGGPVRHVITRTVRDLAPFTWMANAAGLPSMSLPLPGGGPPRGLLVTGPWGSEAALLRFAAWWEAEAPWPTLAPPPQPSALAAAWKRPMAS